MIWIAGCGGMLGSELRELCAKDSVDAVGTGREVDVADKDAVEAFVANKDISWIVNCAAYTAVDLAEDDVKTCRRINVDGARNLAEGAKKAGAKIIHISTDYVFDGKSAKPYTEDDIPCPTGVYGKTKLEGERKVLAACADAYILRTAWLYGRHGKNFVKTMLRLMGERDTVRVVNDQRGSPTWTRELASVIIRLVGAQKPVPCGVYHVSGGGECTWFEFACEIYGQARTSGLLRHECAVQPCTSAEYPAKAARPAYSVLDNGRINRVLDRVAVDWKESLDGFMKEMNIE